MANATQREHGREKSLILFDENEGFNFLAYEMARQGMDGIGTVTECLMRVLEAAKRASPTASQRGGEALLGGRARGKCCAIRIPPLYSANGSLSIAEIIRFINTAPASMKDVTNPEWQKALFHVFGDGRGGASSQGAAAARQALTDVINFWAEAYPAIPEKTRGNIVITVTAALDRFKHGRLNRVFCGVPRWCRS